MTATVPATDDRTRYLGLLRPLLRRLTVQAVDGRVSRADFLAAVAPLGLDEATLDRVEHTLREIGMCVAGARSAPMATEPSGVTTESRRIALALELAARYEAVASLKPPVARGIARLCGLDGDETTQLHTRLSGEAPAAGADPLLTIDRSLLVAAPVSVTTADENRPAATAPTTCGHEARSANAPNTEPWHHSGTDRAVESTAEQTEVVPSNDGIGDSPSAAYYDSAIAAARVLLTRRRLMRCPNKRILTAEEEVGLAVLLRGGPGRAGEEADERELASLSHDDIRQQAYCAMTDHNQRLVFSVCKGYQGNGLELDDLIQYGMLGLMHAVCKFDPRMGTKFSTYATHWIRQQVTRSIADFGTAIRIPVHKHEDLKKVSKAEAKLWARGLPASSAMIAVETGLSVVQVEEARALSYPTVSLDRELFDGATLGDALAASLPSEGPEDLLRWRWWRQDVEDRLFSRLTPQQADILRRRIGLVDGERQTLEEIGAVYRVTRERIRQIESKALEALCALFTESGYEDFACRLPGYEGKPDAEARDTRGRTAAASSERGRSAAAVPREKPLTFGAAARRLLTGRTVRDLEGALGVRAVVLLRAIVVGRVPESAASRRIRGTVIAMATDSRTHAERPEAG